MKKIYKYELALYGPEIELPLGAVTLSVANKLDTICVWIQVDLDEPKKVFRTFHIIGTGERHHSKTN